jgi:hypothetical protein
VSGGKPLGVYIGHVHGTVNKAAMLGQNYELGIAAYGSLSSKRYSDEIPYV